MRGLERLRAQAEKMRQAVPGLLRRAAASAGAAAGSPTLSGRLRALAARRGARAAALAGVAALAALGFFADSIRDSRPPAQRELPTASYDDLLAGGADGLRVVRLAANERVLVFDFPTLGQQGRMFNRLTALTEKAGLPRDRVLDDEELARAVSADGGSADTFNLGHNFRDEALARFFALARAQDRTLNADETALERLLVESGLMRRTGAGLERLHPFAVVSFARAASDATRGLADGGMDETARRAVLRHELSHGEYYTNAAYREHCLQFWRVRLSEAERKAFVAVLTGNGYDGADEELMVNETQAYLMHTPDPRLFGPAALGITEAAFEALRARFREGMPRTWLSDLPG